MNKSSAHIAPAAPVHFADLGVPLPLVAALEKKGITTAFPVQAATLPDCLAGRDVCGKAPTGSGKTLAFGLAVLSRLVARPAAGRKTGRYPSALVLVPTRELAAQVTEVLAPLAAAIGARVAPIYGGTGYTKQFAALRGGTDVVVACPGRLEDLVQRRSVDLSYVATVVVDEADRMSDMGFLPAVRRLLDRTSPERQTLLFSATLDGPVDKLIGDYQRDPVRHDVSLAEGDQGDVWHHFWRVQPHDRVTVTTEVVSAGGPAVVFCRTKRGADRLSERLSRSGLASAAIHGDRSQGQRERALAAFRAGKLDVLVATDVAARGIHVDDVPLVVHFDPPADTTDYVHRSGRTGRAGADGTVVSLVGPEHMGTARQIQRQLGLPGVVSPPDVAVLGRPGGPSQRISPVPAPAAGAPSATVRERRHGQPIVGQAPVGGPARRRQLKRRGPQDKRGSARQKVTRPGV